MALGEEVGEPTEGLLTTAAAVEPEASPRFAAEGSVLVAAPPFSGSATASA